VRQAVEAQAQQVLHELLRNSAIALGVMLVVAVGLGWVVAGRNLRPLRKVTATVQQITHTNLHQRLAATGPDDEFKELSDTFDGLLDRLEASFEAQRRFVANASHELRTPLARQRVIAQVALADPDASVASLRAAHERVLAAGAEQERLIEALLVLARGQHGEHNAVRCDLEATARAVLDLVQPNNGITVNTALRPAWVMGDPRLVEQLVTNLVANAVAHNVVDGRIDVTTGVVGDQSVLVVTNTGPDIPPDAVERLLEPFRRLGVDRTRQGQGLGLGLSIVAAIAASHDAELDLTPRDGGGLVVTVRFPVAG
jgi:signal transduction histidine kinase